MGEALVNHFLGERWQAFSAGTRPSGSVHPMAVKALAELGIMHQGWSKSVGAFSGQPFDVVITVCDDAAENCPIWTGQGRRAHLGFPDPAQAVGSEEEVMNVFRSVQDDMRQRIIPYLETFEPDQAA
jgi:arsenate reductase